MYRSAPFIFMALALVFSAFPAHAQDVTGSWTLTYTLTGPRGQMERTMEVTLHQEGATVTGTALMQMPGRPDGAPAPREVAIEDGKMEGGELTVTITRSMGHRSFSTVFTGTVTGDTMEGTLTMSGGMGSSEPVPFKGKKTEG